MQVVQLKPSNNISFKIPSASTAKFIIGNLTLRTVCIYIINLHPLVFSVDKKSFFIDAFQQQQITVYFHWSQAATSLFKSKLRVYIWEMYDQQSLSTVLSKMFNKESEGNCLLFQQMSIDTSIDTNYIQQIPRSHCQTYSITRCILPNSSNEPSSNQIAQSLISKVISHAQKLGKIKAIYNYPNYQYIIQFAHNIKQKQKQKQKQQETIASFCQVRDSAQKLYIFAIGAVVCLSGFVLSPDLLYISSSGGSTSNKNIQYGSNKKIQSSMSENKNKRDNSKIGSFGQSIDSNKKVQQNNKVDQIISNYQENTDYLIDCNTIQNQQASQNTLNKQEQKKLTNHHPKLNNIHHNATQFHLQHPKPKISSIVKQSFYAPQQNNQPARFAVSRKRSKSQQFHSLSPDAAQFSSASIDVQALNQWRAAKNFQIKNPTITKQVEQKYLDLNKKILSMQLSYDEKFMYLLLRDCIMICSIDEFKKKKIIKYDPIDQQNINLPTPMLITNKQTMAIFANQSYLFWVSLNGEQEPDWKYVQRKQIYTIQVIEQLNLLMVGGKNFSKLSYLGKSTSRSNIKVYNCGKHGKRDHLFTYDIPSCNGQNVLQLKYILTKPNGTKLLMCLTSQNKLFFFRIRAFNHIQMYSCLQTLQIGIQQIISIKYYVDSNIIICLQKLGEDTLCFKYIKVLCSYEKVQIATESVKLPVKKYINQFCIGGTIGNQWITAIDASNRIYSFYLQFKQPEISQYKSTIKECVILKRGALFRQNTSIRCRLVKQ